MARTAEQRLPRQLRNPAAARPARPARPALKVVPPPAEQPVSRGALRAALAAMAFGIALAAAILGLALLQLRNAPTVVAATAAPTHEHAQAAAADETAGAAAAPNLAISTRYNSQLELEITARVSINGKALFKADVAAYTTMVEMPQGHDQGPLTMRELRPGVYRAVTRLPMVGDYAIRVDVDGPARGTGVKTIAVGPHGHTAARSHARHTP